MGWSLRWGSPDLFVYKTIRGRDVKMERFTFYIRKNYTDVYQYDTRTRVLSVQ